MSQVETEQARKSLNIILRHLLAYIYLCVCTYTQCLPPHITAHAIYQREKENKEKENNHHKTSKVTKMTGITICISANSNINGLISIIKETKQQTHIKFENKIQISMVTLSIKNK